MSKIYEALRRHENTLARRVDLPIPSRRVDLPTPSRGPLVRALESVYPIVYRLAKDTGHGLVLHFVSASPGEGTSTLSGEFALVASRVADSRVLLVDADRTQLTTATKFGCTTDLGISDQVQAGGALDQSLVMAPDDAGLHIGALCGQRSPALSRRTMPLLYDQFRAQYELTIVDCPAVFSDRYFELSPEATDGVILVVQAERSRPEIIRQAQTLIENAGGKFIGAILNRRRTYIPEFLYRLL